MFWMLVCMAVVGTSEPSCNSLSHGTYLYGASKFTLFSLYITFKLWFVLANRGLHVALH
jgi:hypothetical protein